MAYCSNCGTEMSDAAPACPKCGHPRAGAAAPGRRTEGSAVAALILGILGVISCPLILSIPAIIVGNQAQQKIRQDPSLDGEGMARAGVILGWVGVGIAAIAILAGIFLVAAGSRNVTF